jgi:hypothetical protein
MPRSFSTARDVALRTPHSVRVTPQRLSKGLSLGGSGFTASAFSVDPGDNRLDRGKIVFARRETHNIEAKSDDP